MLLIERRTFPLTEFRMEEKGSDPPKIVGYAAVFNQLSEDLGGFREKIAPGAFKKTIQEADIRALWNHNPDYVLGRNKSGTLKLEEDSHGLRYEVRPRRGGWIDDLIESIRRRDIQGNSFSFYVSDGGDRWIKRDDGSYLREITRVAEVQDVGPVTLPAYRQTIVVARSVAEHASSLRAQDEARNRALAMRAQSLCVELKIEEIEGSRYL
mgnify:CR=1 FL=1